MDADPRWGQGPEGLDFHHIDVGHDGALRWNSEAVAFQQLERQLRLVDGLSPSPAVVLRATPHSHCAAAERVRRLMDSVRSCREGACYEDEQWVALGYPTYGEHYGPDGRRRQE